MSLYIILHREHQFIPPNAAVDRHAIACTVKRLVGRTCFSSFRCKSQHDCSYHLLYLWPGTTFLYHLHPLEQEPVHIILILESIFHGSRTVQLTLEETAQRASNRVVHNMIMGR